MTAAGDALSALVVAAKLERIRLAELKGADRHIVIAARIWQEERGASFTPSQATAIRRIYAEAVRRG